MPSTVPLKSPVARNDSRLGMRMLNSSEVPSGVPMVKIENEAPVLVLNIASAAAIFIGCCSVMILAWMSPVMVAATAPISATPRRS